MSTNADPIAPKRIVRARRYVSTFRRLLLEVIKANPLRAIGALSVGTIARLAPLAGIVITIQSAFWIISDRQPPSIIVDRFGEGLASNISLALFVLVPGAVFLTGSICQQMFDRVAPEIRKLVAMKATTATFETRLSTFENEAAKIRKLLADLRYDYQLVQRSVSGVINVLLSGATFAIAGALGMFIAPIFVSSLLACVAVMAIIFVAWRHGKTHKLLADKGAASDAEVSLQKVTMNRLQENVEHKNAPKNTEVLSEYLATGIGSPQKIDDAFRADTTFISSLGQVFVIVAFLIYLAQVTELSEERAAQLILLVIVIRLCIGTIQNIATSFVALSRDYPRLSAIMADVDSKAFEIGN